MVETIIYAIGFLLVIATISYIGGNSSDCSPEIENSHKLHIDNINPKRDNLQLIRGIGKVLEATLNEKGIYNFKQIANLSKDEILKLNNSIAFPGRIEREDWVAQAKELQQES